MYIQAIGKIGECYTTRIDEVDTLDKLINKDTLRGAKVPNPQTPLSKHQFKYEILVTTYGNPIVLISHVNKLT
jgi:hypothetical protein